MPAEVFGIEHFLYIGITSAIAVAGLLCAKRYLKNERSQDIFLKCLGALLLVFIMMNRLSQVFRYGMVRWEQIVPDSYCGMTSLVLALAVLFGKKDNVALHFTWILAIFGGISTVIYPSSLPFPDSYTIVLRQPWLSRSSSSTECTSPIKNGIVLYSVSPVILR